MAKYQTRSNKEFSMSLFEECFKDYTEEEKIKIAEQLGKIQEYCRI